MNLDKLDLKILKENFDDEMITKIDDENVSKIMVDLEKNGILSKMPRMTAIHNIILIKNNGKYHKFPGYME